MVESHINKYLLITLNNLSIVLFDDDGSKLRETILKTLFSINKLQSVYIGGTWQRFQRKTIINQS